MCGDFNYSYSLNAAWPDLPLQSDSTCQSETSGWIWGSFYSSALDLENKEPNLSLSERA